ncbi:MAG: response regulator [Alphaproteobacteria bacterium]|nr:response regulator [Alphaproteobacteria bacterium]
MSQGQEIKNIEDLKILVVDDQPEARAMLKDMIVGMGVTQIFESKDGRQALEFIDAAFDFVDIIVCDWNMPSMNGVELLRQIRSVDPEMPFLMVTGRTDIDSVVEAKSSGVTAYIRKPFSPAQFEAKLRIVSKKVR